MENQNKDGITEIAINEIKTPFKSPTISPPILVGIIPIIESFNNHSASPDIFTII